MVNVLTELTKESCFFFSFIFLLCLINFQYFLVYYKFRLISLGCPVRLSKYYIWFIPMTESLTQCIILYRGFEHQLLSSELFSADNLHSFCQLYSNSEVSRDTYVHLPSEEIQCETLFNDVNYLSKSIL